MRLADAAVVIRSVWPQGAMDGGSVAGAAPFGFQGCGFFMTWARKAKRARTKGVHGPTLGTKGGTPEKAGAAGLKPGATCAGARLKALRSSLKAREPLQRPAGTPQGPLTPTWRKWCIFGRKWGGQRGSGTGRRETRRRVRLALTEAAGLLCWRRQVWRSTKLEL